MFIQVALQDSSQTDAMRTVWIYTVRSESCCALRLQYVGLVQACIDNHGHHFQNLLSVHNDFHKYRSTESVRKLN
jgi:hypothetical protein